jgi:hypothetical protein
MTSNKNTIELSFNGKVQQGHEPYFEMGPTKGSVRTLNIKSVALHHTGIYTCVEENGQGDYHLIYLTVTKAEPVTSRTPTLHSVSSASTELSQTVTVGLADSTDASRPRDFKKAFIVVVTVLLVLLVLVVTAFIGLLVYILRKRRKSKKVKKDFAEGRAEDQPCLEAANRSIEVKGGSIKLDVIENHANNNTAGTESRSSQHATPTTSEDHT